ncbi:serine-threonine protein kinase [Streptomyces sp. H27-D2]|uniref:serine-threonine protein kinase n=1 Tax=Streptomyces sp. H27-D2 TaxID=3046304 RepID=UPI002DBDAEAE|nr:serine-threonine protein kinase [Streptomyces sp. H27-D2]MEC4018558.1 serine-threonine protein kinase [Streptomyces sp. H27-D2]
MAGISVEPYSELTFDADGDVSPAERDRLMALVSQGEITDLLVFAHGWNNDRSIATRLYGHFFEPFPRLLGDAPGVRLGYVGVLWPAMRFSDEPIPDFDPSLTARTGVGDAARHLLGKASQRALNEVFPGHEQAVSRLAELLGERPRQDARFEEFARLVRELISIGPRSAAVAFAADHTDEVPDDDPAAGEPAMLADDPVGVCEFFGALLAAVDDRTGTAAAPATLGIGLDRLWNGAHELLRQATYYAMKRRAGTVGQLGLGPVLGRLADASPDVRIHLLGHSFGGRLVSFALRGLPEGVTSVRSTTLLQGAFSHYAFAERLPHAKSRGGALNGVQNRVAGPLVSCYSHHDSALGTLYPIASRVAGDTAGLLGLDSRWGAVGYDGIQAVPGSTKLSLADALRGPLPADGCVSVDVASVVRHGPPPAGAHSDICHEELAGVMLAAGRIGR